VQVIVAAVCASVIILLCVSVISYIFLCLLFDTHTHPFNGPFSGTTQVSQYQKGKANLDFTGARDSERHWRQLDHMQVCTLHQTDNHTSTPPLSFFTGRMPFLFDTRMTEKVMIAQNLQVGCEKFAL